MNSPRSSGAAFHPLAEARARFAAGQFAEAEASLGAFVAANPRSAEALELLGACLGAQGRHEEALQSIDRAAAIRGPSPAGLHNRAQALLALGRAREAHADLQRALALRPDFAPAWTGLARALEMLGDRAGAEKAYRQPLALNPASAEALYNLSRFLYDAGRVDEAIAGYRKALAFNPNLAAAHNNLGNALRAKGDSAAALHHFGMAVRLAPTLLEALTNYAALLRESGRETDAIDILERGLRIHPGSPAILNSLGIAYYAKGRFADAERCYREALARVPFDDAEINLGNALAAQGRAAEAIARYRAVVARSPANADALSNLGIALQEQDDLPEAMEMYTRALAVAPDHSDALNNLGFLLEQEGRGRDAMALYEKALAANPRSSRAAYNLALAKLAHFEFRDGWALADPARFEMVPPVAAPRSFAIARFDGNFAAARKLAVWREQGVGDQILYATTLPDLEARGVDFVLEADRRLLPAFKRAHPQWEVVAPEEAEKAFATCDRHVPVGSLPAFVRESRESFERQPRALLAADSDRAAAMGATLAPNAERLLGISWRSFQPKVRGYVERRKSAPLAAFGELARRDGVRLVDLQYGDTAAERDAFAAGGGRLARVEGLDLFNDLDGVLAAIAACDAIVTTSNVTAHLAGSVGKRTFLVYPGGVTPFHYWATDASGKCLWYPSITIVTASDLRTWPALLARVGELLDERAA